MNIINKLDQYLLTNYPTLWNLRIPHLLVIILPIILVITTVGYLSITQENVINSEGFFSSVFRGLLFSITVLSSIVLFILWIIQYNKNNAISSFYPRKVLSVYGEWFGILIISFLFISIPCAFLWGAELKVMYIKGATDQQTELRTVIMADVIIAPYETYYTFEDDVDTPLIIDENTDIASIPVEYLRVNGELVEYVGPSFLYFKDQYNTYDTDILSLEEQNQETEKMQKMLRDKDVKGIRKVMEDYLDLYDRYGFEKNLSVNQWFDRVYNPPLYQVNNENLISTYNDGYNLFINKYELTQMYKPQYGFFESSGLGTMTKILFYLALGFSLLIFSARISKGTNVLFAFIGIVVVWFAFWIYLAFFGILGDNIAIWVFVYWFAVIGLVWYLLLTKIASGAAKKKSTIYIHIAIWFLPILCPLIFALINELISDFCIGSGVLEIINLLFVTIIMYPVAGFCLRWKALPES